MPRVSVIIPLYNKGETIARTLHSVYAQEFRDFEVIVVDDGSTDGSRRIVQDLNLPSLRLVSQENAGPGAARNRGARSSDGSLLAFIDGDDEWLPSYLGRMVTHFDNDLKLASATAGYLEYPSGSDLSREWERHGLREGVVELTGAEDAPEVLTLLRFMQPLTTVVRKEDYLAIGGYYDRTRCLYGEDSHLFLKLLLSRRVWISLEPLARYHREDSSLSSSADGPRPIEPFLVDPEDVEAVCPPHLSGLLGEVLEARANKTACMLGYWGRWREARELRRRFERGGLKGPLALPAIVAGTPLGSLAGATARMARRVLPS